MSEPIIFDKSQLDHYLQTLHAVQNGCRALLTESSTDFQQCKRQHSRIYGKFEQEIRQYKALVEQERSASDSDRSDAEKLQRLQNRLHELQELHRQFDSMWTSAEVQTAAIQNRIEGLCLRFQSLSKQAIRDLDQYTAAMDEARRALYDGQQAAGPDSAPQMSAGTERRNDNSRRLSLAIGGKPLTVEWNKTGFAKAYRRARETGDTEMMARTSAMFEIETLRSDLELTAGEDGVAQIGGYHSAVQEAEPAGYDSHHIPSRAIQSVPAGDLPALAVLREDHKRTASYAGRQAHTSPTFLPDSLPNHTYKETTSAALSEGSSGYVELIRAELYDLRSCTGHRYDGAVSAYLDTVIDMLASRGIPECKT